MKEDNEGIKSQDLIYQGYVSNLSLYFTHICCTSRHVEIIETAFSVIVAFMIAGRWLL
jgi:hypothetical protein